jgi:hypothetical protein
LQQLAEPWNEEATERRDHVAGRTLSCHDDNFSGEGRCATRESAGGSAPVKIRTSNLLIRSQMLYPVELRARGRVINERRSEASN